VNNYVWIDISLFRLAGQMELLLYAVDRARMPSVIIDIDRPAR